MYARQLRVRSLIGVAGMLALSALASGCDHAPSLRMAGDGPTNRILEGVAHVQPHQPTSLGSMIVCLSKPGRVTITAVKPVHPVGHITVQSFAVRPSPFVQDPPGQALGDEFGRLSEFGFSGSHIVDIACGSRRGAGDELGLQVEKPTTQDVGVAGWLVEYKSDGSKGQLTVPLAVKLCSEASADSPPCRALDHHFLAN